MNEAESHFGGVNTKFRGEVGRGSNPLSKKLPTIIFG